MTNKEKYVNAFVSALGINQEETEGLKYQQIQAWDSVGHMTLITEIEDAFDIMLDTDEIIALNSFEAGMEILTKGYGIDF